MFSIRHLHTNEGLLKSASTYVNQHNWVTETAMTQDKRGQKMFFLATQPVLITGNVCKVILERLCWNF